jgi:hypothetical protein
MYVFEDPQRRTVMSEIKAVGFDLAKNLFQGNGADASGRKVLRKKLRRGKVLVERRRRVRRCALCP